MRRADTAPIDLRPQVQNTTTPYRPYRLCHCHGWRFDECPNTAVADWARGQAPNEGSAAHGGVA